MKCKVCNKDVMIELDFRTLFKLEYSIHESCNKKLELDILIDVIPIENNIVNWIYFFEEKNDLNYSFLEFYLIGKGIQYCLNNTEWSIVVWMTSDEYFELEKLSQFLLLNLADQSIVFLSLFRDM
jgi:hypothetical protein